MMVHCAAAHATRRCVVLIATPPPTFLLLSRREQNVPDDETDAATMAALELLAKLNLCVGDSNVKQRPSPLAAVELLQMLELFATFNMVTLKPAEEREVCWGWHMHWRRRWWRVCGRWRTPAMLTRAVARRHR